MATIFNGDSRMDLSRRLPFRLLPVSPEQPSHLLPTEKRQPIQFRPKMQSILQMRRLQRKAQRRPAEKTPQEEPAVVTFDGSHNSENPQNFPTERGPSSRS